MGRIYSPSSYRDLFYIPEEEGQGKEENSVVGLERVLFLDENNFEERCTVENEINV